MVRQQELTAGQLGERHDIQMVRMAVGNRWCSAFRIAAI
jgi:hypothetical protein